MPAKLTANLAIAVCGELFTEAGGITELLRIVSQAEVHLGLPGLKASNKFPCFCGLHDFNVETRRKVIIRTKFLFVGNMRSV